MRTKLSAPYVIGPLARYSPYPSPREGPSPPRASGRGSATSFAHIWLVLYIQVKAPQITHFEVPFQIWITASLLLFLIYSTSVPPHSTSKFWSLARALRHVFPDWVFTAAWAFMGVVHASEGLYVVTLVRKHHMPWPIAVRIILLFRSIVGLYRFRLNLTYWVSQTAWVSFATVF